MSFSSLRMRARASFGFRSLAIGILLWPAVAFAEPVADIVISVNVDQAKLIRLPTRVSTIVVGNPLIADVALQGGIVVVTGKGYGATNFIAMDRGGEVLVERMIQVEGPTDRLVTVYRGIERESWTCMPVCQQRVTLGDGEKYFKSTIDQAGTLSSQAAGSAAAAAANKPN